MARQRQTDLSWKKYFIDPGQWWDHRNNKRSSKSPDFKHKITIEHLWIDGSYNSSWVHEELRRRGMLISSTEVKHAELCVRKEENGKELQAMSLSFVASLKDCAKKKDLRQGTIIHSDIRTSGLLVKNTYLGNMLVSMYAKCGAVAKAQQVLDELPVRNVVSWNALIAGYCKQGLGQEGLECYERMRSEGLSPNAITYTCMLKACGITRDGDRGKQLHDEIVSKGLLGIDVVVGNALVDMYAKCGAVAKAQQVLDELPVQDVVSWNALIAGYAQQGLGKEALNCYERMRSKGVTLNAITYTCILKACGITQDADKGKQIHDEIVAQGLLRVDVVLCNALVDMYAKCGAVAKAQQVLDELRVRNVVSFNALIAGYAQHGLGEQALDCYERMRSEGLSPNAITYTCILRACGMTRDVDRGKQIHDEIVSKRILGIDVVLGNTLVDMYSKCGAVAKAQGVLDGLPVRDIFSWSALIVGYAQQGQGEEALDCYERMRSEGVTPNAIIYSCTLRACAITRDAEKGRQIHDDIVTQGLLGIDVVLGNALVNMYAKCGAVAKAQQVFDEMPIRDVVSWNALIAGYAQQEQGKEALNYFQWMQSEGVTPNAVTYTCILKACGITRDADRGKQIHDEIVSHGLLGIDVALGNALVDMYAKCGVVAKAQQVLDELPVRNVVSWSALIAGYAQQGLGQEALDCYERMRSEGLSPNAITYTCILKACGITRDFDRGKQIHGEIVTQGLLGRNVVLGNALVDMYVKCAEVAKAQQVLGELPVRDVVSWSALIGGYAKQGLGEEALDCYERMQSEGLSSDAITYICVLKACGITRDVDRGKKIHDEIVSKGLLGIDVVLGNALVDMYAKCGAIAKAQQVLDKLPVRDVVSWTALIAGYAQQGQCKEAMDCFQRMQSESITPNLVFWNTLIGGYAQQGLAEEALDCFQWMQREGTSPDAVTFVCVLKACCYSGLVNVGQMYFNEMREKYGITLKKEHHTCMVDFLAVLGTSTRH